MHRCALVAMALVAGCSRSAGSVDASSVVDAAAQQAPHDEAREAAAAIPDDASAATKRSCDDLDAAEKAALETCASSRIHGLGYMGAFTVRVAMSGTSPPRTRAENDIQHAFRDALPGDACDRAAEKLAAHLPCTWDVRGPFPTWTIRVVQP